MLRLDGRLLVAATLCGCPADPPTISDGKLSTSSVGETPWTSTGASLDSSVSDGTTDAFYQSMGAESFHGDSSTTPSITESEGYESSQGESQSEEGMQSDESSTGLVESANAAPEAMDDVYLVRQDETLIVDAASGVLSNDIDPDADALTTVEFAGFRNSCGPKSCVDTGRGHRSGRRHPSNRWLA